MSTCQASLLKSTLSPASHLLAKKKQQPLSLFHLLTCSLPTSNRQQFIREKARADASRLQNSIPIRPPPVPPPKPTYQPPQTEASENQYPRRSFRDRFNPFGDSQRHYQHERDDRLTESTTSSKSGSDSFELQHMKRNGMNHSHDSLTLHGSPIDPEKMYPKMF